MAELQATCNARAVRAHFFRLAVSRIQGMDQRKTLSRSVGQYRQKHAEDEMIGASAGPVSFFMCDFDVSLFQEVTVFRCQKTCVQVVLCPTGQYKKQKTCSRDKTLGPFHNLRSLTRVSTTPTTARLRCTVCASCGA